MESQIAFLYELFCRDPAYFQRLLEFLLHARFRSVRLNLRGALKQDAVFFSLEGQLINIENNKKRFNTLTEWYNATKGTKHARIGLDQFKEIMVTSKFSIYQIIETVRDKEVADFIDMKYRSSILFTYISHRIRAKRMSFTWDKSQTFSIEWNGVQYSVTHTHTSTEAKLSVGHLLDAITNPEEPITGLYLIQSGKKHLLTEDRVVHCDKSRNVQSQPTSFGLEYDSRPTENSIPPLLPTPAAPEKKDTVEVSLFEFRKMQQDIQTLTLLYVDLSQKLSRLVPSSPSS